MSDVIGEKNVKILTKRLKQQLVMYQTVIVSMRLAKRKV